MQKILRIMAVSAVFWVGSVSADPGCQNAEVIGGKLITDICWSCIFPIKVAGVPISGGGGSFPSEAVSNPLCMCEDNLGVLGLESPLLCGSQHGSLNFRECLAAHQS